MLELDEDTIKLIQQTKLKFVEVANNFPDETPIGVLIYALVEVTTGFSIPAFNTTKNKTLEGIISLFNQYFDGVPDSFFVEDKPQENNIFNIQDAMVGTIQ